MGYGYFVLAWHHKVQWRLRRRVACLMFAVGAFQWCVFQVDAKIVSGLLKCAG
jgi:hypothetical protein